MNIALIIERMETWRGGAETSTVQFAGYLARNGCRVTVVTATNVPSTPALNVVPIRAQGPSRAVRTLLFTRRAEAYVRGHGFDIVHSIVPCVAADVYQPRGGLVPEMLERNAAMRPTPGSRRLKAVIQWLTPKYGILARRERRLLRRRPAPWVIAISQYVAEQLQRHYGFDPSRVRVVFNGVDCDPASAEQRRADRLQVRRQFGLADDDLVVLCAAHNFKLKGVGQLIEALARCQTERSYALIVGRDNPAGYAALADGLGVSQRVIFAGPTQRMPAFYHAADLLAHPTFYDPCSRVVLEALAAGLPVITTRFNGAAEIITDGVQGYVIDSPHEVGALADRIDQLANDDHRRACAASAVQAVQGISMKEHAEKVQALYREILAGRSGARSP